MNGESLRGVRRKIEEGVFMGDMGVGHICNSMGWGAYNKRNGGWVKAMEEGGWMGNDVRNGHVSD